MSEKVSDYEKYILRNSQITKPDYERQKYILRLRKAPSGKVHSAAKNKVLAKGCRYNVVQSLLLGRDCMYLVSSV